MGTARGTQEGKQGSVCLRKEGQDGEPGGGGRWTESPHSLLCSASAVAPRSQVVEKGPRELFLAAEGMYQLSIAA